MSNLQESGIQHGNGIGGSDDPSRSLGERSPNDSAQVSSIGNNNTLQAPLPPTLAETQISPGRNRRLNFRPFPVENTNFRPVRNAYTPNNQNLNNQRFTRFNATNSNINYANQFPSLPNGQEQNGSTTQILNSISSAQTPSNFSNFVQPDIRDIMAGSINQENDNINVNNTTRTTNITAEIPDNFRPPSSVIYRSNPETNYVPYIYNSWFPNSEYFSDTNRGNFLPPPPPPVAYSQHGASYTPHNPATGSLLSTTPPIMMDHNTQGTTNLLHQQQSLLYQKWTRELNLADHRARAIDKIRETDFTQLTNENISSFIVWKRAFELNMKLKHLLYLLDENFIQFANIESSPNPRNEVYQNNINLYQLHSSLIKQLESNQLKEISKTISILIYVLQDNISIKLVHTLDGRSLPNIIWLKLNKLHLNMNLIEKIQLDTFNGLGFLTELHLNHNNISELEDECFFYLINLKRIDLSFNKIKTIPSRVFKGLDKSLSLIYLNNNDLCQSIQADLFNELYLLSVLYLNNNSLSFLEQNTFKKLTNLAILNLSFNCLERLEKNVFIDLIHLEQLDLSNNQLTELDEAIFQNLKDICKIDLSVNQLDRIACDTFAGLAKLKRIYLANNRLTSLVISFEKCVDFICFKDEWITNDLKDVDFIPAVGK
jgi:Leucine-rich repeat (LRR) protein